MDKVRIGIIGCGGIAQRKHLPSLAKVPEAVLTGLYDVNRQNAETALQKFGGAETVVYPSVEALLQSDTIDAVHICTPNDTHAAIAIAAMEAGKHVMCEKPMAHNVEMARKMVETSERTGKKLCIGCQNRYRYDSMLLKKMCEAGELGDIYFAKAHAVRRRAVPTWGTFLNKEVQGGGPLIDIGVHALDLTLWEMNNFRPKYVVGTTYRAFADQHETGNIFGEWKSEDFTVEDSAFGFVVMENGATVILESSWALNTLQTGEAKTTLCGTKAGADMMDGLRINGVSHGDLYIQKTQTALNGVDFYEKEQDDPGYLEARYWIDCILEDTEPFVKPREALTVMEIINAIYRSQETGKPVYLN